MSEPLLIQGTRIVDPAQGMDQVGDIMVRDGAIVSCGPTASADGATVVQADGLVAAPGFIDLHAHLREPGFEDKETIATGALAGARGGFTTICCMPNTSPAIDSASVVRFILQQAKEAALIRVLPVGAVSRGRAGTELTDMEELMMAGAVAFSDDGSPVADGHLMQMALTYARDLGLPVINHCEEPSLVRGWAMHEGWVASRLGLPGYPAAGEESMIARDIALAELTGGHVHIAHLSTAGGTELVRQAKARGVPVTAEVTPQHLTMTEEWVMGTRDTMDAHGPLSAHAYDSHTKVNPPLRAEADRQALVEALREGVIDAVATDHAPHTMSDKAVPFEEAAVGLSVLETAFGSLISLVHQGSLELPSIVHRLTVGPASVLGTHFEGLGSLRPGTPADIVLFDPGEKWTVCASAFASKGANTPLDGATLKGRVKLTIAAGQVVYDGLRKPQTAKGA
jgi:dihydroorotase